MGPSTPWSGGQVAQRLHSRGASLAALAAVLVLLVATSAPVEPIPAPSRTPEPPRLTAPASGGVDPRLAEAAPVTERDRLRCLGALAEEGPIIHDVANLTRSMRVERNVTRNATMENTSVLHLIALGFRLGIDGTLRDVQDYQEVERLTCTFEQDVNLSEENVFLALALGVSGPRPGVTAIAQIRATLTLTTVTNQTFRLGQNTTFAALVLQPDGFSGARALSLANITRESTTHRSYRQEVVVDPHQALLALVLSRDRAR